MPFVGLLVPRQTPNLEDQGPRVLSGIYPHDQLDMVEPSFDI